MRQPAAAPPLLPAPSSLWSSRRLSAAPRRRPGLRATRQEPRPRPRRRLWQAVRSPAVGPLRLRPPRKPGWRWRPPWRPRLRGPEARPGDRARPGRPRRRRWQMRQYPTRTRRWHPRLGGLPPNCWSRRWPQPREGRRPLAASRAGRSCYRKCAWRSPAQGLQAPRRRGPGCSAPLGPVLSARVSWGAPSPCEGRREPERPSDRNGNGRRCAEELSLRSLGNNV